MDVSRDLTARPDNGSVVQVRVRVRVLPDGRMSRADAARYLGRLGGGPDLRSPFPERPKGMHHRTYQRLRSEAWGAEMMAKSELGISLRRVLQRDEQLEKGRMARARSAG